MDSGNVIVGSGVLRVAPIGTALPNVDGTWPVAYPSGWTQVGYTDDGVEIGYAPSWKDITVDEEMAPVKKKLVGEKMTISAKLAEATLDNLNRAIAAAKIATAVNTPPTRDTVTLKVGSATDDEELMIAFEGPSTVANSTRILLAYRAKATAAISLKYNRQDKVMIPVEFEVLADSTKPAGERLAQIVDIATS